ncbi:MAG: HepT-like ribonuclease domain-containing protein [Bacteroidota bacterium]
MPIKQKDKNCLQNILDSINKINSYTQLFQNADELYNDNKSFDAVLMNFVIIGEMVAKLSDEFKENNSKVDWSNIKGFRNIIAHQYFGIDAEEVWGIILNELPILKRELEEVI